MFVVIKCSRSPLKKGVWAGQMAATRNASPDVTPEAQVSQGRSWGWTEGWLKIAVFSLCKEIESLKGRSAAWPHARAIGKADPRRVEQWLSSKRQFVDRVEAVSFPSSCVQAFSSCTPALEALPRLCTLIFQHLPSAGGGQARHTEALTILCSCTHRASRGNQCWCTQNRHSHRS